jgi:hypothetical protein
VKRLISISDIPLVGKHPDELLGIHADDDFWEWGWGIVPNITLGASIVERALVLLLHAPDEPKKIEGDVQIAFWVDVEHVEYLDEEIEVHTTLKKFLDARLPEVLKHLDCDDVVLCVCNPHHSIIERPACVPADVTVHFPKGYVYHYKEEDFGMIQYLLAADEWTVL